MNPDEVFALLRRADPASDAQREDSAVTNLTRRSDPDSARRRMPGWVRPVGFAAAAALAVVVAIGPLGLLGGNDDVIEAPVTTATTPTTAVEEPVTTVETPSTTPSTPVGVGGVVIANGETITWGDGDVTPGVDVAAKVAYDDWAGGVVYQTAIPNVGDRGDSTVYHLPFGATEPQALLSPSGSSWLQLVNVTEVDGAPTALVVESRDPMSFEDATDVLLEVNLATGESREVAVVGGWESGLDAISWDGSTYVTSSFAEAYTFVHTLDRSGNRTPWEGAIAAECYDNSSCPTDVVASADGQRLVMIRQGQLVTWDRVTDTEVQAIDVPEGIYVRPILSGDTVVLNRFSEGIDSHYGVAVIVDLTDGSVTEAPYAGFVDWIDGPAIDVGPVEGRADVESLPSLLIDGVEQAAAVACAGADGAIVFVFDDGSRAMVGFEEGTFIRSIGADGTVSETSEVTIDDGLPPTYTGTVDIAGTPAEISIVAPSGVDLPDCSGTVGPAESRVFGYVTAIEEIDGQRFVVFDQFEMLTGEEAEAAAAADGAEVANDYYMVPVADAVSYQLLGDATVTVVDGPCCDSTSADLEQWVALQPGDQGAWSEAGWMTNALPYWFTLEGGVITAIEQQYLP